MPEQPPKPPAENNIIAFPQTRASDAPPLAGEELQAAVKQIHRLDKHIIDLREEFAIVQEALNASGPDSQYLQETIKGGEDVVGIENELADLVSKRAALEKRVPPDVGEKLLAWRKEQEEGYAKLGRRLAAIGPGAHAESSEGEPREFRELREKEAAALAAFFGYGVEAPPLPAEVTLEKMKRWESMGLKLRYLPDEDMRADRNLPGWKKKTDWKRYLERKKLAKDATRLRAGWVLVDETPRPNYDDGKQMYENDFLAPVLQQLHRDGVIKQAKYDGTPLAPTTRFGISPKELEDPRLLTAMAQVLEADPRRISCLKASEYNFLGNLHHSEWDAISTSEWFSDQYDTGRRRLRGGHSDYGGLSFVYWVGPGGRDGSSVSVSSCGSLPKNWYSGLWPSGTLEWKQ